MAGDIDPDKLFEQISGVPGRYHKLDHIAPEIPIITVNEKLFDVVNRPAHYNQGTIEVFDFIRDQNLNFALGNTVKYVARAGKKDPTKLIEDLEKAMWYLRREIEELRKGK